jgi:hypothetical protein
MSLLHHPSNAIILEMTPFNDEYHSTESKNRYTRFIFYKPNLLKNQAAMTLSNHFSNYPFATLY